MIKRKEVGHTFKAWCGPHYRFILNDDGELCLQPARDPFFDDWKAIGEAMTRCLDVEKGLLEVLATEDPYYEGMTRQMRREAKANRFKSYYAGLSDHAWRLEREANWPPLEEGESRMTIHHPPLEF